MPCLGKKLKLTFQRPEVFFNKETRFDFLIEKNLGVLILFLINISFNQIIDDEPSQAQFL